MQPNKKKNAIAVIEASALVIGESKIKIKVSINLKRLLIVNFNVKAVRI